MPRVSCLVGSGVDIVLFDCFDFDTHIDAVGTLTSLIPRRPAPKKRKGPTLATVGGARTPTAEAFQGF